MTGRVQVVWNAGKGHAVVFDGERVVEGESQAIADAVAWNLVQLIDSEGQWWSPSETYETAKAIYNETAPLPS